MKTIEYALILETGSVVPGAVAVANKVQQVNKANIASCVYNIKAIELA